MVSLNIPSGVNLFILIFSALDTISTLVLSFSLLRYMYLHFLVCGGVYVDSWNENSFVSVDIY